MARTEKYTKGTSASGTEISSEVTGFQVPRGFAGVIGIYGIGAGLERITVGFPGGERLDEEVPVCGEIIVETKILQHKMAPCYWKLKEGTRINITPYGSGTAEQTYFVKYGRSQEFDHPEVRWIHVSQDTSGPVADGTELIEVEQTGTWLYAAFHGANFAFCAIRIGGKKAAETIIPGSHEATNAKEQPLSLEYVGEPVIEKDKLFYGSVSDGIGTGAASDFYFGLI